MQVSQRRLAVLTMVFGLMGLDATGPASAAETGATTDSLPDTAVVFTCVPNRVLWGVRLLDELLIEGFSSIILTRSGGG